MTMAEKVTVELDRADAEYLANATYWRDFSDWSEKRSHIRAAFQAVLADIHPDPEMGDY